MTNTIPVHEIIKRAKQNGIELKEETIKINESGLDFQVTLAESITGEKWLLRIPRREDVFPKTKSEKIALDYIAHHVSFEVPIWEVHTPELIAYKQLSGVPAATIDMEKKAYVYELDENNVPESYHQSLANCLAELHKLPLSETELPSEIIVQSPEQIRATIQERMLKVKEEFPISKELWSRWQRWLANDEMWPKQTGMLHGDDHVGHMLINEEGAITGMIDWTEAQVADISKDFLPHYMVFGEEALDKLLYYYEQTGGYTWPKMKEHIIELHSTYPIDVAEFAISSGLDEYKQMALEALGTAESK
ncbi:macrolide 2'-phosphotransferase [Alkalihalobacillus sp. 1P02AB]|uniref:macrolide 2'-phosphotransferase n=1 Tax=Alkalihalobacillus sp. 1P02AB TaxID=3132260 RepID=UPI0039A6A3A3